MGKSKPKSAPSGPPTATRADARRDLREAIEVRAHTNCSYETWEVLSNEDSAGQLVYDRLSRDDRRAIVEMSVRLSKTENFREQANQMLDMINAEKGLELKLSGKQGGGPTVTRKDGQLWNYRFHTLHIDIDVAKETNDIVVMTLSSELQNLQRVHRAVDLATAMRSVVSSY